MRPAPLARQVETRIHHGRGMKGMNRLVEIDADPVELAPGLGDLHPFRARR
jgi:hypothetical protein